MSDAVDHDMDIPSPPTDHTADHTTDLFYVDHNHGLLKACRSGNTELADEMITKGARNATFGLYVASKYGHVPVVTTIMARKHLSWDTVLFGGCVGGQTHVVDLAIQSGANNWNQGLIGACRLGHIELTKLMITKGATTVTCLNSGLYAACMEGHKEIVERMVVHGATDLNEGLHLAHESNHVPIVEWLCQKGATNVHECSINMIVQLLNRGLCTDKIDQHKDWCRLFARRSSTISEVSQILQPTLPRDVLSHVVSSYVPYVRF